MKTILKIFAFIIVTMVILWGIVFKTPIGVFLYNSASGLANTSGSSIQLIGAIVILNLAIIFGILGYIVAGQRGKSRLKWTLLCLIFNFWAFLVLVLVPSEKK